MADRGDGRVGGWLLAIGGVGVMREEKCDWHAKGIWTEGLCYCGGCCSELFGATDLCREAMEFVASFLGHPGLDTSEYMEAFEEKKRAEWRSNGGVRGPD
jgi:hypothetical protein